MCRALGLVTVCLVFGFHLPLVEASGPYYHSEAYKAMKAASAKAQSIQQLKKVPQVDHRQHQHAVKQSTQELGKQLKIAQQHFVSMKVEYAKSTEILAAIEKIETQLAVALKKHDEICDHCEQPSYDHALTSDCCRDLLESLGKAMAAHEKLLAKLPK